jgi:Lrp/AsnC family transcriptional regulator for asnA, asnC and gidA
MKEVWETSDHGGAGDAVRSDDAPRRRPDRSVPAPMRTHRRALDILDARIIRLLQADGRLPNTEVARQLGMAEATVRNRVDRLLRDGIIQVGAWPDPLKLGYQTYALIEIQVEPRRIVQVAERLARMPELYFVGICTGAFDIYAGAVVRSVEDMYELTTQRLARIPGIVRTTTSSVIRLVKRDYSYPVPGFPNDSGPDAAPRMARRRATRFARKPSAARCNSRCRPGWGGLLMGRSSCIRIGR